MTVRASVSRREALDAFGQSFKTTNAALRRLRGRESHHPDELSYAQFNLLFTLCERAPLSLRELAHAAGVSPATAAEMLDPLETAGLVERARSTDDRRITLITLSARGETIVDERRARYEPRWRAALKQFDGQELLTAAAVLDSVRAMFDELADES
jgi:DNA-binding MarR family transcriptional regulator